MPFVMLNLSIVLILFGVLGAVGWGMRGRDSLIPRILKLSGLDCNLEISAEFFPTVGLIPLNRQNRVGFGFDLHRVSPFFTSKIFVF